MHTDTMPKCSYHYNSANIFFVQKQIIEQAPRRMLKKTTMAFVLCILLTGCMTTRYVPFDPSEISSSSSSIRITLNNSLQYVLEDAAIGADTIAGVVVGHGFMSFPRADIKMIEKADGNKFDGQTALRLTGIVLTISAIIAVSCAVDRDCTRED